MWPYCSLGPLNYSDYSLTSSLLHLFELDTYITPEHCTKFPISYKLENGLKKPNKDIGPVKLPIFSQRQFNYWLKINHPHKPLFMRRKWFYMCG